MSSRDSVRSKKVKRKTIKVRRDRMFGMSSRKSNFFRLKNISDKRNLGKINLEKVLEDGPREIKRLPYSLKLKAKLLSISEVKNDPLTSPKRPKYPTRLMHRYKKEIRQKRNSVVVRDRARSRPKSNMEVAHVVNGQDLSKEERGNETNGFGTVMSVKNGKDRKKRDKRKKFSNFYYRRSMEDPMPKLSFKKNDSAICL